MDFRNAGLPLPFTRWWLAGGAGGAAATFSGRWSMMQAKTGDGIAAPGDNQRRGSAADQGQSAAPGRRRGARKKRRMGLRMGELGRRLGSAHGIVLTLFSPRYLRWYSFSVGLPNDSLSSLIKMSHQFSAYMAGLASVQGGALGAAL